MQLAMYRKVSIRLSVISTLSDLGLVNVVAHVVATTAGIGIQDDVRVVICQDRVAFTTIVALTTRHYRLMDAPRRH